jgi:hypothetical protein
MSDPDAGPTTTPASPAPPGPRIRPRLIVAVTVAVVMFLGLLGLIAVVVLGDDDDPTGAGLERQVDVDEPATAPPGTGETESSGPGGTAAAGDTTAQGGETQSGEAGTTTTAAPTIDTAAAVNSVELVAEDGTTPPQPSEPVEFPVLVTNPAPPTTFAAVPLDELDASRVSALEGWSVSSRDGDHVTFTNDDDEVLDVFVLGRATTAAEAMAQFYDDRVGSDVGDVTGSPLTLLGAPSERYVSVAGSQYVATAPRQQGTIVVSGSTVTAVGEDGRAVVIATSRLGTSSDEELAADGELLRSLLAHL